MRGRRRMGDGREGKIREVRGRHKGRENNGRR